MLFCPEKTKGRGFRALISVLLAILLSAGAFGAGAAEEDGKTAVLTFSSFDGGGFEYSVAIDDPQILAYTARKEYGSDRQAYETGSAYQVYYTFFGLKPGGTRVTVTAFSPIIEGYETVYSAEVDDSLKVTLTAPRSISRFELYLHGETAPRSYAVCILQNEPYLSVGGGNYRKIHETTLDALNRVFEEYDVAAWDGFSGHNENVLDGEGFRLEIWLSDGRYVLATGDNAFPENYYEVIGQWLEILEGA